MKLGDSSVATVAVVPHEEQKEEDFDEELEEGAEVLAGEEIAEGEEVQATNSEASEETTE